MMLKCEIQISEMKAKTNETELQKNEVEFYIWICLKFIYKSEFCSTSANLRFSNDYIAK